MIPALFLMLASGAFFTLGILEISFPELFSWSELLIGTFPSIWKYAIHIGVAEVLLSGLLLWPASRLAPQLFRRMFETYARLGLGGMFIAASLFKIHDPHQFAVLVAQYQLLPHDLINGFALFMPMLEILVGTALILTPFTRENSLLLFVMFIAFIIALAQAVLRDLGITCGCFAIEGAQDKSEAWISLIRDIILLAPNLWLVFRPNRSLWKLWRDPQA